MCATNGFAVEYPDGWLQSTPDSTTIEFNNPTVPDIYAIFKTPGATTLNANTLLSMDLTNNYASKPGYSGSTPTPTPGITPTPTLGTTPTVTPTSNTTTIGGENWSYAIVTYQLNGTTEQVEVFATVHKNNAYIIELQAPQAQFDSINTAYFESMLNRFAFPP